MSVFSGTLQDVCVSVRSIAAKQGHDGPKWDIMGKEVSYQIGPKGVTLHIKDEASYAESEEQVSSCAKPVMDDAPLASQVDGALDPYATTTEPSVFSPSTLTPVLSPHDPVQVTRRTKEQKRPSAERREEGISRTSFPAHEHDPAPAVRRTKEQKRTHPDWREEDISAHSLSAEEHAPHNPVPTKRRPRVPKRPSTEWRHEDLSADGFAAQAHTPASLNEKFALSSADSVAQKRAYRHRSRREPPLSRLSHSASTLSPSVSRRQVDAPADSTDATESSRSRVRAHHDARGDTDSRVRMSDTTTLAVHHTRGEQNGNTGTMVAVEQAFSPEKLRTAVSSLLDGDVASAFKKNPLINDDACSSDEDAVSSLRTRMPRACSSSHSDEISEARLVAEQDNSGCVPEVPVVRHEARSAFTNEDSVAAPCSSLARTPPSSDSSSDALPIVSKKRGRPPNNPSLREHRPQQKMEPEDFTVHAAPRTRRRRNLKLDQSSDSTQSTMEPRLSDTDSSKPARTAPRKPRRAPRRTVTSSTKPAGASKTACRTKVAIKNEKNTGRRKRVKKQLPRCSLANCSSIAKGRIPKADKLGPPGYRCITHGGGRRCCAVNCSNSAKGVIAEADGDGDAGPRCIRHGGGTKCTVEGCERAKHGRVDVGDVFGPAGPRCTRHGGGARCSAAVLGGCANSAVSSVYAADAFGPPGIRCKRHGGGRRCSVVGCATAGRGRPVMEADFFGPPGFRCGRHGASMLMIRTKEHEVNVRDNCKEQKAEQHGA